MQTWEYETIILEASGFFDRAPHAQGKGTEQISKYLNEMGAHGWELVAATPVTTNSHFHMLYLKRPSTKDLGAGG
jgi:hypothetical protein